MDITLFKTNKILFNIEVCAVNLTCKDYVVGFLWFFLLTRKIMIDFNFYEVFPSKNV